MVPQRHYPVELAKEFDNYEERRRSYNRRVEAGLEELREAIRLGKTSVTSRRPPLHLVSHNDD